MADAEPKPARLLIVDGDGGLWDDIQTEYRALKATMGKRALAPVFVDTVRASQTKLSDRDFTYAGIFVNPSLGSPAWMAVIRTAHQYRAGTPVFVIYDQPPKLSEKDAGNLGVYGFHQKPITYKQMLEMVTGDLEETEVKVDAPSAGEAEAAASTAELTNDDFAEVDLSSIVGRIKSLFDLYVRLSNGKHVKILNHGDILSADRIESYKAKGMTALYILKTAQADYLSFFDGMVQEVMKDEGVAIEVKAAGVAAQGESTLNFLKSAGFSEESLEHAHTYVNNSTEVVNRMAQKNDIIKKLLEDVTSYEHSTACTMLAGLIIKNLGGQNPAIFSAIGVACFLHDISLVGQSPVVLAGDESKMSPEEVALYRAHPEESAKIIKKMKGVAPIVVTAVAQHHLRSHKQGFPADKAVEEVNRIAELIGLCEEFLLLIHKQKTDPSVDPIAILGAKAPGEFSSQMMEAFTRTFKEK